MKTLAIALALSTMLTVKQRDARRSNLDQPTSAVSADGRFIAFVTYSQLAPADGDKGSDVYVLDRARQHATLESASTGQPAVDSHHPGISGDGRYLVYERAGVILLGDRKDNVTKILAMGHQPSITANGRAVVFTAGSFDRVTGVDANGPRDDVYSIDLFSGQAQRVSVDLHGMDQSLTASVTPSVSTDGRYVAFSSRLPFEGGRAHEPQIFVRDTQLNVTKLVAAGWRPSISGDGRFVAFVGRVSRLPHIFLADLQTGATRIITKSVRRGFANGASANPRLSADGRFIAFQSEASDLVAAEDFNLLWDVFVFDRTTDTMARVSGDPDGVWMEPSGGPSIDARGSVVAFSSRHPTDVSDKQNDFDLYVAAIRVSHASTQRRGVTDLHGGS